MDGEVEHLTLDLNSPVLYTELANPNPEEIMDNPTHCADCDLEFGIDVCEDSFEFEGDTVCLECYDLRYEETIFG